MRAVGHDATEPDMWARSLIVEVVALQLMVGHSSLRQETARAYARAIVRLIGNPIAVRVGLARAADMIARGHYHEPFAKLPIEGQAHVNALAADAIGAFFSHLADVPIVFTDPLLESE